MATKKVEKKRDGVSGYKIGEKFDLYSMTGTKKPVKKDNDQKSTEEKTSSKIFVVE